MTPNQIIQEIIRQKDQWIITGTEKIMRLLDEMRKQALRELGDAAITDWSQYRLKQILDAIERSADEYTRRLQAEFGIEIKKLWDLGQQSVYRPLNENGIYTGFGLSQATLDQLSDFSFHKIAGVVNDAFNKIKSELTLGVLGGKTPQQVADAIGQNLKDPSIFTSIAARAEVITKTELGRTFSMAAERRRQQAAEYVPGLIKIWDHAGHPQRPRLSHLVVHGQQVPVDEPFKLRDVNGYQLMYPHDPNADISEVINCGCDAVTWKTSWGEPAKTFRPGGRPGTEEMAA